MISQLKKALFRKYNIARLRCRDFSIISSNCIGSRFYQELGLAYNTPFVGLYLHGPCFMQIVANPVLLCEKIHQVNYSKYSQKQHENYPIGCLGDEVEIHFLHYGSWSEAHEAWHRRLERLNWDRLFWIFTDRDECNSNLIKQFDASIHAHKVCFTATNYPDLKSVSWIKEYATLPMVGDLYTNFYLIYRNFDIVCWLNGESGKIKPFYKSINHILNNHPGDI